MLARRLLLIAILALLTATPRCDADLIYFEDFESAALIAPVDDSVAPLDSFTNVNGGVWNTLAGSGLAVSNGGKDNITTAGVTEWTGFNVTTHEFWVKSSDQDASSDFRFKGFQQRDFPFNYAGDPLNIFAVADSDEFADKGTSRLQDEFNVFLRTPTIDLSSVDVGSLMLSLDSSFRPFSDSTATINTYFDGDSVAAASYTVPGNGPSSSTLTLNAADLGITGSLDPSSLIVEFAYEQADDDWWWAVDDLRLEGDVASVPEPSSLFFLAAFGVGCAIRRKSRSSGSDCGS